MPRTGPAPVLSALLCTLAASLVPSPRASRARAEPSDQSQWGERHTRNMVSAETGLPDDFDPATGRNVKWTAELGSETYGSPVVAGGKVLIGTNNQRPRDPRHKGDRGVLLCLDEKDGSLVWQLVVPKIVGDVYLDWPAAGLCSPPSVEVSEGNKGRVYVPTNRAEVVCLDLDGMADGNDGPYTDEARHQTPTADLEAGRQTIRAGETDADIIWLFDMRAKKLPDGSPGVGMYPHDTAHASILIHDQYLYLNTGNGVDNTHRRIRAPDAPSLIVLDKATGRLVARDDERIGPRVFHCTWSSPALGEPDGRPLVFYGGADGIVYAFKALLHGSAGGPVERLKRVWRFDCDPGAPKENVHKWVGKRRPDQGGPSTILGMPVFHNGRIYVAVGGDVWWGKTRAWLKCIDAGGTGDITDSGEVWSYPLNRHCCSTPSIHDGLVYIADCGRHVHCLDAETGRPYWTHRTNGPIWGSTLLTDGKVYIGTRKRDFWVLAAGREKKVLSSVELDSGIVGTPTAANGVLYVATMRRLYAVQQAAE